MVGSVGARQVVIGAPLDEHVTTESTLGLMLHLSIGPWSATRHHSLVVERNVFDCEHGADLGGLNVKCSHCFVNGE